MLQNALSEISVSNKRERFGIKKIKEFIENERWHESRVLALCGLPGTGNSVLVRQAMECYKESALCLVYEVQETDSMDDVYDVLEDLREKNRDKHLIIWLQEITRAKDFITNSACLADIFALYHTVIIITGHDTLAFDFTSRHELFDRMRIVHMNHISVAEYCYITGDNDIRNYVCYGGLLCSDRGKHFVKDYESVCRYVEDNIAENIFRTVPHGWWHEELKKLSLTDIKVFVHEAISLCSSVFAKDKVQELLKKAAEDDNHSVDEVLEFIEDGYFSCIHYSKQFFHERVNEELYNGLRTVSGNRLMFSHGMADSFEEALRNMDVISKTVQIDFVKEEEGWSRKSHTNPLHVVQPAVRYYYLQKGREFIEDYRYYYRLPEKSKKAISAALDAKIERLMLADIVMYDVYSALKGVPKRDGYIGHSRYETCRSVLYDNEKHYSFDLIVLDREILRHWCFIVSLSSKPDCEQEWCLHDETIGAGLEFGFCKRAGAAVLYNGDSLVGGAGTVFLNIKDFLSAIEKHLDMEKAFEELTNSLPVLEQGELL